MASSVWVRVLLITGLALSVPALIYYENYHLALSISIVFALIQIISALISLGYMKPM